MQREQIPVPQEIELKLSVAPRHAARVWKSSALSAIAAAKPVTRKLFTAYYDTPDFAFRRSGAAVRLRRESGRWVQAVKSGSAAAGGLHSRSELQTPVPAQLLNYPALVEAGLGEVIAGQRAEIEVVFTTSFRRRLALVEPSPGYRVEIALDRGEIAAGARHLPVCEIELELKSGEARALFRLARELAGEIPLRLENESKAERGYRLAAGEADRPLKAAAPQLHRDMGVDSAFVAVAASCLRHLQANECGLLEADDPEYVHQARVALRRLRCAFGAFSRAVPKAFFDKQLTGFAQVARALGQARDLELFLAQTLPAAGGGKPGEDLTGIGRLAGAAARKARAEARAAIAASGYTLLMLDFAEALSVGSWRSAADEEQSRCARLPLAEFCAQVLSRRDRKTRRRGNGIDQGDPGALHLLRIEIKKLRYACEFFASLYPRKKSRGYLQRLYALQEVLGSINDATTAGRLLQALTSRGARPRQPAAVAYLRGYLAARTESQLAALSRAWAQFERTRPFW